MPRSGRQVHSAHSPLPTYATRTLARVRCVEFLRFNTFPRPSPTRAHLRHLHSFLLPAPCPAKRTAGSVLKALGLVMTACGILACGLPGMCHEPNGAGPKMVGHLIKRARAWTGNDKHPHRAKPRGLLLCRVQRIAGAHAVQGLALNQTLLWSGCS